MNNLLNGYSHFGFASLLQRWEKEKKENDSFLRTKIEEKQNSATIMTSVEWKGTIFPVKLKLKGKLLK